MIFSATPEQVQQMACNAVNAASPVGMGALHFEAKTYTPEELPEIDPKSGIYLDYFHGRMTKLCIQPKGNGDWEINSPREEPNPEYQSWAHLYPTKLALVNSVLEEQTA